MIAISVAFAVSIVVSYVGKRGFLTLSGRDRSGRAVRAAPAGLRSLPAPVDRVPRALHVRPRRRPADLRHGLDLRTRRRRHRRPGAVRDLGRLGRRDPARARREAGARHADLVPVPDLAVPLVPAGVGQGLPAHARDGRAGHRAVRRVDGRHPRGADVPSRAPQPGDLRGRQRRLPAGEHEGVPTDRPVLAADQGDRQRDDRGRPDLRRLPRAPPRACRSACSPRSCSTCAGSSSRCRS